MTAITRRSSLRVFLAMAASICLSFISSARDAQADQAGTDYLMNRNHEVRNQTQNMRISFGHDGLTINSRMNNGNGSMIKMRIASWGYGRDLQTLGSAERKRSGNRVEYVREGLTEWYVNRATGLEQGFTVTRKPGEHGSRLKVLLGFDGVSSLENVDADRIEIVSTDGARLHYSKLFAEDADGRTLPSSMNVIEKDGKNLILLEVQTLGARFPVLIDPLFTNPDWTAESNVEVAYFGEAVLSGGDVNNDGYEDLVVGGPNQEIVSLYLGSANGLPASANWSVTGNQDHGRALAFGDVNGDGYDDIIVGAEAGDGEVHAYFGKPGTPATSPSWTVIGDDRNLGCSVACSDVNGDGYDDVIVGDDDGSGFKGIVHVYLGSAGGPAGTPAWSKSGSVNFDDYGAAVSGGDVNGDGYGDVIVGAPGAEKVQVFLGAASGPSSSPVWTKTGDTFSDFGNCVTTGDVNGDGNDDLIVGAVSDDTVFVYHGSATGPVSSASATVTSPVDGNPRFGVSIATGDINGDSHADVIIGAHWSNNPEDDEGSAHVYQGSASGLASSPLWSVESNQEDAHMGRGVSFGDVNGDGWDDAVVGAPRFDNGQNNEGKVFVYHAITPGGILEFAVENVSVNEGAGTVTVSVARNLASEGSVSVDYLTRNGTAIAGSDYTAGNGTLSWTDGDSASKDIEIDVIDNSLDTVNRTFAIELDNPLGQSKLSNKSTATITIIDNDVASIEFTGMMYTVNEDGPQVALEVRRLGGTVGTASIDFASNDGTATAGTDYTPQSDTLTWTNGDSDNKTITIPITDDGEGEGSETFTVSLSNPANAQLGSITSATVTIVDNDLPVVQFVANSYTVDEDGAQITLEVSRTSSVGAISVDYDTGDNSATAGTDYAATTGTLTWTDGDSATKTIQVTILDDSTVEVDEDFNVSLSNPSGCNIGTNSPATVTITENDVPTVQFAATSYAVDEDGVQVTLEVSRNSSIGAIQVDYATADGTAEAGSDYTATTGTLIWADGDAADKTIDVLITDDNVMDADETFTVSLNNPGDCSIGAANSATVTITENDTPGKLTFVDNISVNEGDGTATLSVSRIDGTVGEVSVTFTTVNGSAVAGSDFTAAGDTLTWADGDAADKEVVIDITDDEISENQETFTVSLSAPTNGAVLGTKTSAIVAIAANDQRGEIAIADGNYTVTEGNSIDILVARSGGSDGEVSVYFETIDNSAEAASDYTATSGTLTWTNGDAADKVVTIDITDDSEAESNEDFSLELSSPTGGATLGNDNEAITITANDSPGGIIAMQWLAVSGDESVGTMAFRVTRTAGSVGTVTVDYCTIDDTSTVGVDYETASGTLTWEDGESDDKDIVITVIDDTLQEGDEQFSVILSNVSGAVLSASTALATIVDNDNSSPVITDGPNADPLTVPIPGSITLDVTATDADGDILNYAWSKQAGAGAVSFSAQTANTVATFNQAGSYTIEVVVTDDHGGSATGTVDVTVTSGGATGDGEIEVSGNSDFGATYVEDGSIVRTFTIRNTGTGALLLTGSSPVSISGFNASDFSVSRLPAVSIATGESTTFDVTFDPASAGSKLATLHIASDDPTDGAVTIEISGEALEGATPVLPPPGSDDDGCGIASGLTVLSWLPMILMLITTGIVRRRK